MKRSRPMKQHQAKPAHPTNRKRIGDWALVGLLARFMTPYWQRLLAVFALLLGVTSLTLLPPYLIQRAVDGPIKAGDLSGLVPYGVLYFASILVTGLFRYGHTYLLQMVGQTALMDLRQTLFEHILRQDMRFF